MCQCVYQSVLNFSLSVVPQTNVIVSSEPPKTSSQEDTPLENLLSKWVAHIHTVCLVWTEVINVEILPNTTPHKQCWCCYCKTEIKYTSLITFSQSSVQTIECGQCQGLCVLHLPHYKSMFLCSTVAKRRQNTILVKVPGPEESQEEQESGSEASDSVSNGGHSSNAQNGQNVTLITLNSEGMTSHCWYRHRSTHMYRYVIAFVSF